MRSQVYTQNKSPPSRLLTHKNPWSLLTWVESKAFFIISSQEQMGLEHQNQNTTDFKSKKSTSARKYSLNLQGNYSAATGAMPR